LLEIRGHFGGIIGRSGPFPDHDAPEMPPTDSAIRTAKPASKPVRLFDAGGLFLETCATGAKRLRLNDRFAGKKKRLALGADSSTGTMKDLKEFTSNGIMRRSGEG
jgi:hypothetical protein